MSTRLPLSCLLALGLACAVTAARAQTPEPPAPDPLPAPDIPLVTATAPDWATLFPGAIADPDACKARGGRWVVNDKARGCVVKNLQEGIWLIDDDEGGYVGAAITMKGGELDGPSMRFHPNGRVSESGMLAAGKKIGAWYGYWDTGAPRFVETWADDKKVGAWIAWHPSGQPEIVATFVDGQLDGDYSEWHRSCAKSREGRYVAGKRQGTWRQWTDKGILLSEGAYKDDLEDGPWKHFHGETGALVEEGGYVAGVR